MAFDVNRFLEIFATVILPMVFKHVGVLKALEEAAKKENADKEVLDMISFLVAQRLAMAEKEAQ